MFTGIVEETGIVERIESRRDAIRLSIRAGICGRGLKVGDSLAVNGCCLTVVKLGGTPGRRRIEVDLLRETWRRTNLQFVEPGSRVNLERSLPANGRLHGHFVTGHVDATGRITRWEQAGNDWVLEVTAPAALMRHIVFKGSIAVDGISLTVAGNKARSFLVWIIPHTREVTALASRKKGDRVNLEADLLAKYVESLLSGRRSEASEASEREKSHCDY